MKKIELSKLFIAIAIPVLVGFISGIISSGARGTYEEMIKPSFSPPGYIFPIVWTILYILMGISSYLVVQTDTDEELKKRAIALYVIQLVLNFFWPILFFNFHLYLFSFLWLVVLIVFIIMMIRAFYDVNKLAAYLQIPYLLWCVFASVLNFTIFYLNK